MISRREKIRELYQTITSKLLGEMRFQHAASQNASFRDPNIRITTNLRMRMGGRKASLRRRMMVSAMRSIIPSNMSHIPTVI